MPSKSVAQQKFMGMVHAVQKGDMKNPSPEVAKAADTLSDKDAKDFASTKLKGLPDHVKEATINKLREYIRKMVREASTSDGAGPYLTPYAFGKPENEKAKGKRQADLTGYAVVKESKRIKLREDFEVDMAQTQLDNIIKAANQLKQTLGNSEKDIPAWAQDHISKAENYITQVAGGYDGSKNEAKLNEDISDIQTPIYFKSKKGVTGFDNDTTFFVKDIPSYGNIKVYRYDGRLERFIWFYKDMFAKGFKDGDFYEVDKKEYKPNK
jgi:hypothetical protein